MRDQPFILVHKAELLPNTGRSPDDVLVDETANLLNDEQYWLCAAVDPDTNELLHTTLGPTINKVPTHAFFADLREKHDIDDAMFLINGSHSLKDACCRHGLDFRHEQHRNRNSVEHVFREIKVGLLVSQTVLVTSKQVPPIIGFDLSPSHGINLSEHCKYDNYA